MNRATTYRWAAVTAAAAAGLAVLTALAAPFSTTQPSAAPSTMPAAMDMATPASTQPASSQAVASATTQPTIDRSVAAAADAARRAAASAPPPVTVSTRARPMSSAFEAVLERSIFMKGEQRIGRDRDRGTRPSGPLTPPPPVQAGMVFNGVTFLDDRADAMIEDVNAHRIFTVRAGEVLAGGRVLSITFDNLEYQYGGKVIQVGLGMTLEGHLAPPGSSDPPSSGASPPPADTAPLLGSTAGMSAEDILARMKKRRQMEMNGGK